MEPQWDVLRDPRAEHVWRSVLQPIAVELSANADALAVELAAQLQTALPGVFPDTDTVAENEVSVRQTIDSLADVINAGADPRHITLPPATLAFAEVGAHRQIASALLVRAYRLGHEALWTWLFTRISERTGDAATLREATALLTRWTFGYADAAITQVEEFVEAERERWLRSALATRSAAITAILHGEEHNTDRATQRLRYTLARHHLGVAAATSGADTGKQRDPQDVLADTIGLLAAAVSADATLIHPTGVTTCMAWLSRARPFTDDDLVALVRSAVGNVRVAVGETGKGLDGFRRSQVEAGHARRVASEARLLGVVRYGDVAVAALAGVDAEQATNFVRRMLGPLAGADEASQRAAEALTVYLEENRSRTRAGARLNVHPNTVTYRVQQAEQLLGRTVPASPLDLRVALALLPTLRRTIADRA
ncbi:MAG: helix-turn-helix domain-containing protein [Nocardiaceae bacterium]|nr:helix-turn-helix domain-containing protein [Nocardiaceae bacterium]